MYESIIIRSVLLLVGSAGVWAGWPIRRVYGDPIQGAVAGILFMCGMFAIIGAVFAK